MNKGLQTQGTGVVAVIAIVTGVINQLTDGDPLTNPDWNIVVPMLATAVGVFFSRAKKQSSEAAGAIKG